jgi:guanine nucleotide-binding protein subunit alpha, other
MIVSISTSYSSILSAANSMLTVVSFLEDLDRLFASDYLPTDQDILKVPAQASGAPGVSETIFDLGSLTYRMLDIGYKFSDRNKWIHTFDNVSAVLFVVAIDGYDQSLVEDRYRVS